MTALDLIGRLMALEPPLFLFGGFAEDAVLHGRLTRPHADVDVFVWRDDLPMHLEQAGALGFLSFRTRFESAPGKPLAIGAVADGLDLEFCVADRASDGRGYFEVPGRDGQRWIWLPEDALTWPVALLEGLTVRTVSPLTLYQIREAVAETFGGPRPKDLVAQAALRARFFGDTCDDDLRPRVTVVR
jgi:hypothetical protein